MTSFISGEKDSFMISYLIAKNAEGISQGEIACKSRKDLKEENRSVVLHISKKDFA